MAALADSALAGWPLAVTLATVVITDRVRAARRRTVLNRALHELRRPLQALALAGGPRARGQVSAAAAGLAALERELNGGSPPERRRVEAGRLARDAAERWQPVAAARGRAVELRWTLESTSLRCDPSAIGRALDNLIANSLEHGRGTIRIAGTRRPGRVRFHVSDGVPGAIGRASPARPSLRPRHRRADPRRGHGLAIAAAVAAAHGGRFGACVHPAGASSVLEIPVSASS